MFHTPLFRAMEHPDKAIVHYETRDGENGYIPYITAVQSKEWINSNLPITYHYLQREFQIMDKHLNESESAHFTRLRYHGKWLQLLKRNVKQD